MSLKIILAQFFTGIVSGFRFLVNFKPVDTFFGFQLKFLLFIYEK